MIYVTASYANAVHTMVTGTDAAGNTETVPADFTVFRQPEHGPVGFVANGGVIQPYETPSTTIADVKAEARRRIIAIMDEDKQRNTQTARMDAIEQYGLDRSVWPEAALLAARLDDWAEIERLRARSDAIELMEPIPADIGDDGLWAAEQLG